MKRTKYEHLSSTISHYLKRRQFPESDSSHKKESRWTQPVKAMALKGSASGEVTTDNMLAYSSISGDATTCEQQFSRLKTALHEIGGISGTESLTLMFPVFVHMYLEMLNNGHKAQAHKFFSRHHGLFRIDERQQQLLELFVKLYSKADLLACREAQEFRDMKYQVPLTQAAFDSLQRFLKMDDNMMMMQIFNHHIKLQVRVDVATGLGLKDEREGRPGQPISPAVIPDNKVVHDDQALTQLKQTIREVRAGPPGLPSICFYTFLNAEQGLCCASISPSGEYLCGGFEDSSLRMWRLTPGLFPGVDKSDGPSGIFLAADYITTRDDDEDITRGVKDEESISLKGHVSSVYQARFTWDSNFLLSCSDDTTVRLWDLESQSCSAIYRGHNYPVWDLDTSLCGSYFATCSHDQTAKLWCTERAYPLRSFIGHTYDVDCVRFHPNSNYMATGSGDKTIRLWSVQEGKSVRLLPGHKSSVLSLAFSPNGTYLASAGEDRRVRIWDLRTGTSFKEFRGHTDTVYALSFNQNSSLLASGGLDSCIRIWDIRKTASQTTSMSDGHNSAELLGVFTTKSTPVSYLNFTDHNVLHAAGAV